METAEEFLSVFWRWGRQPVDGSEVEAEGKKNTGQALGLGLSSWWRMAPLPETGTLGEEDIWRKQSRLLL